MKTVFLSLLTVYFFYPSITAQNQVAKANLNNNKKQILNHLDQSFESYKAKAMEIWSFAEMGYQEHRSSALLQKTLSDHGFNVQGSVAGIPTAFVASYGSGKPVIAILAEYDALPGMAQKALPEKAAIEGQAAGHACGHHLFGVASVAAGIEIKKLIEQNQIQGTIRIYGCPAEEGGSGKVYMVREGLFDDVDVAIHWHPGDRNQVSTRSAIANKSAKFRFYGIAAHAAGAPDKGRSALDAVEAMNYMGNMLREHVPQETRIHYVITQGGKAPNIVPDFAEVYYYVRHPDKEMVKSVFNRIVLTAEAAAHGTETRMDFEVIGGTHDLLINRELAKAMQGNLEIAGGVNYTDEEIEFARKIQSGFDFEVPEIITAGEVRQLETTAASGGGSTDVGDVSYTVPTVGMSAATWVPGTPAHSWQAVACGGTNIGAKGMIVAAKTLALTAYDLYTQTDIIQKASQEFLKSRGDYQYEALLGDRKPALDYRN